VLTEKFTRAQINGLLPTPSGPFDEPVSTPEPDQPLTAEQEQAVDDLVATSTSFLERATELSDLNLALIQDALSTAGIELPNADFVLPDEEITRHAWIQVADGPVWVDYATVLSGAQAGVAPTTAQPETAAQVPTDLVHMVTIRVVAEEYVGGSNVRRDAMSLPFASADLVNEPVALLVVPPQSVASIGFTLNALFTGQVAYVPAMLANDIGNFADSPLMFGNGEGDIFSAHSDGPLSLAEGEALAMWLAIDIASPGQEPVTVERPLYDRLGFEARQAETIDFSIVEPVTTVTASDGQTYITDLTPAYQLSIDSAYIPYAYAARDIERQEMFGGLVMTNSGMLTIRDSLRAGLELPKGLRSVISGPNVTLVTGSKLDPSDLSSGVRVEIDMLHRASTTIMLGESTADLHPSALTGVTDQVAEQVMIELAMEDAAGSATVEFGANVGEIFSAAIDQGITVVTISELGELSSLDLEPEALVRIASALESGLIVVVPETSVELGGLRRSGWWLIDPVTGVTRDELDNGKGSASFSLVPNHSAAFSPVTEETYVIRFGTTASEYYRLLGLKILCYAGLFIGGAGIGMALALGPDGGGTAAAGAGAAAAGGAALTC
jgi:hypothetical protein